MAKNDTAETTAVALIGGDEFRAVAVIREAGGNLMELLQENVGEQISVFDFAKLTVPSGGGDHWSVPTPEGTRMEKEIEGIVLLRKAGKAYWSVPLDDSTENTPPDCTSEDGVLGVGAPGGRCAQCPLNQFGTASRGKGKACKDKCDLFILTKTGTLPMVVQVPPTSLKGFKQYGMMLLDAGKDISKIVTKFSLASEMKSGKKTAVIQYRAGGDVDPSMYPFIHDYKTTIRSLLVQAPAQDSQHDASYVAADGDAPKFE